MLAGRVTADLLEAGYQEYLDITPLEQNLMSQASNILQLMSPQPTKKSFVHDP